MPRTFCPENTEPTAATPIYRCPNGENLVYSTNYITMNSPISIQFVVSKWPSRENFLAYKKVKSKCTTLTRKTKKRYFEYIAKNKNFATTKTLWNTVRPSITNKGAISDENIKIKAEENQNIRIKNKNKSKLVSIKINGCI